MIGLVRALFGVLALIAFSEVYALGHGPIFGTGAAVLVFLAGYGLLLWLSRALASAPSPVRTPMQPTSSTRRPPRGRASGRRRILRPR